MKTKFLLLSLFIAANSINMFADKHGNSAGGGTMGIQSMNSASSRSLNSSSSLQVHILNSEGEEIDCVPVESLKDYVPTMAQGSYTFIYVTSEGEEVASSSIRID